MKKMMKLGKIFLLVATIFSYVASPISVLADEVITSGLKPLVLNLDANEDGTEYTLSYISANPSDYEDDKSYKIELITTATYTNGDVEKVSEEIYVNGLDLENLGNKLLGSPVSNVYNAEYTLEVSVYDDTTLVYTEELEYKTDYIASVGLTGNVNEEINGELAPEKEVVGENDTTIGNYNVTEGKYTQKLSILPGELSPKAEYRVLIKAASEEEETEYSVVMDAEDLALEVFDGTQTDLTGKLAGTYSYVDSITFEEVDTTGEELVVERTYTYKYNANLVYGTDNDLLFTNMYGVWFVNEYMMLPAKGLENTEEVITIGELVDGLVNTGITLEVLDEEGNKLYPEENLSDGVQTISEEEPLNSVLDTEVKNGYTVKFTNGATASYDVVVIGDANSDNEFTHEDLVGVIEGYIDEEDMPSMGMIYSDDVNSSEEIGSLTFEDVIVTNELLKEEPEIDRDEDDNEKLELGFGELSEDVYVGDTIEIDVLLNEKVVEDILEDNAEKQDDVTGEETDTEENEEEEVLEFIEGIDGTIKLSDNLKIKEVKFNEAFTGGYNEEGRVVAVGNAINKDAVVMTLVLEVVSLGEGKANIEFSGSTSKYLNIDEFEAITTEFDVIRRLSANNNLRALSASAGKFDIDFNSEETIYTLTVPHNTESVELSGLVEDEYAKVEGLGKYELKDSKTTALITVTAEDGTTKVYTVYIVKEAAPVTRPIVYYYSSNNYLKSLVVEGYELEFDKNTSEYKITVGHDVTSLDISALAEDYRSRVEITGNSDFKEGENIVIITVTAENGSVREYKLVVEKEVKTTGTESESNTAEKIVIIVLIILVVLGLLYLIFKKDEEDMPVKRENPSTKNDNNVEKKTNNNKDNSGNKKKNNNKNKKK